MAHKASNVKNRRQVLPACRDHEDGGQHEEGERRRCHQSPMSAMARGNSKLTALPPAQCERNQAKERRDRRHEDRAKAHDGPLNHGLEGRESLFAEAVDVIDHHDAVVHGDADEDDEPIAGTLNGWPTRRKAATAPTSARGTVSMRMSGCFNYLNWVAITAYTNRTPIKSTAAI